jgi:hypothetical protein
MLWLFCTIIESVLFGAIFAFHANQTEWADICFMFFSTKFSKLAEIKDKRSVSSGGD